MSPTKPAEPNGLANLKAILADQPFRNSGLSVHEIEVILANEGGFMPDEAALWFRAARGNLGAPSAHSPGDRKSKEPCPNFPGCHCRDACIDGWSHPEGE